MARSKGSKDKRKQHKWTNEEKEYLTQIYKKNDYDTILKMMNDKFECSFNRNQIISFMRRNKLKSEAIKNNGRFSKGMTPWNKGLSYMPNNKETRFQKGNIPHGHREVGEERIDKYGYVQIKVAEPNKWDLKHRVIYEKHYGEIPKNHAVIFADGDKSNLDIDNLLLVSRQQLLVLNRNNLISEDKEITKTGINIANIMIKLSEIEKDNKK